MMQIRRATMEDSEAILVLMKQLIDEHRRLDSYYKPFSEYKELPEYVADTIKDRDKILLVAAASKDRGGPHPSRDGREDSGKIIAYFIGTIEEAPYYSSEKKIGVVADTCVDKKHRRSGILKNLFVEALAWFDKKGVKFIELSVDARNSAAVSAWKKLGFSDYKLRMRLLLHNTNPRMRHE